MLRALFFAHLGKLTLRNGRLLIALLELLVSEEVLSHDAGNLSEIIEHSKTCIFHFLFGRTESTKLVIEVESRFWIGNPKNINIFRQSVKFIIEFIFSNY